MIHSGLQQPPVGAGGGRREALKFLTAMKTISSTWTWATSQIGIFATTIGTVKSRLWWRIFIMVCIKSMIKIIQIIIRRGAGGEGDGARTSRLRWQNFLILACENNDILSPLYCHEASPTSFEMIELILKFRHHNRDVRPPSPSTPPPLLLMILMNFIILLMQTIIKNPPPQSGFWVPIVVAKIPIWLVARVQVEEIVFYSVHNPAPSTSSTTPPSLTTPSTQNYYVHYKV